MKFTTTFLSQLDNLTSKYKLCKRCIGRATGRVKSNETDITLIHFQQLPNHIKEKSFTSQECELCQGTVEKVLEKMPALIQKVKQFECKSFLIGTQFATKNKQIFDDAYLSFGIEPMLLKHEINREVGLRLMQKVNIETDFENPELNILIKINKKNKVRFFVRSQPLFFGGRYRKLKRGIPQTKWPCTFCKGKRCKMCDFSGLQYKESVEGIISKPFLQMTNTNETSFHGAGREDIDALMLGNGRPFIIEIKNPKKRKLDLKRIQEEINSSGIVEVRHLHVTSKEQIKKIKSSSEFTKKTYRALVETENDFDINILEKLPEELVIDQKTPMRVLHRRADIIRRKKIYSIRANPITKRTFELLITAQGGAYIKEFISGDCGRTKPNISELLQMKSQCIELDVLEVMDS